MRILPWLILLLLPLGAAQNDTGDGATEDPVEAGTGLTDLQIVRIINIAMAVVLVFLFIYAARR